MRSIFRVGERCKPDRASPHPTCSLRCARRPPHKGGGYKRSLSSAFKIASVIAPVPTFVMPSCMMSAVR